MTVGSSRHFESSFAICEWLVEQEQYDRYELTDEEIETIEAYHEILCRISNDIWGVEPPNLPEKVGDVPLHDQLEEKYNENE